jgi:hypothetical protein
LIQGMNEVRQRATKIEELLRELYNTHDVPAIVQSQDLENVLNIICGDVQPLFINNLNVNMHYELISRTSVRETRLGIAALLHTDMMEDEELKAALVDASARFAVGVQYNPEAALRLGIANVQQEQVEEGVIQLEHAHALGHPGAHLYLADLGRTVDGIARRPTDSWDIYRHTGSHVRTQLDVSSAESSGPQASSAAAAESQASSAASSMPRGSSAASSAAGSQPFAGSPGASAASSIDVDMEDARSTRSKRHRR